MDVERKQRTRPSGRARLGVAVTCFVTSVVIGAVVGVIVALFAIPIAERGCSPDDECIRALYGVVIGFLAGGVAAMIAVILMARYTKIGMVFGFGAAAAIGIAVAGTLTTGLGWAPILYFVAAVLLVIVTLAGHHEWQPTPGGVIAVVVILGLAGAPLGRELYQVRAEQHRVEAVIEQPLQPDLEGTWPWGVKLEQSEIFYSVLEPRRGSSRIAEVEVTLRLIDPAPQPCAGFAELVEGGVVTGCTEIEPGVWRGQDRLGKALFWVRGPDRQWALVTSSHHIENTALQRARDARAQEVALSLKPRSSVWLAASSVDCGFCEWFA